MSNIKMTEEQRQFCEALKSKGFIVYIAQPKNGTRFYGFFTNEVGDRVVSFQYDFSLLSVSGNYRTESPKNTGTGWRIADGLTFDDIVNRADVFIESLPPRWAHNGFNWRYEKASEHISIYPASNFVEA